jgi:hypothetical protein
MITDPPLSTLEQQTESYPFLRILQEEPPI